MTDITATATDETETLPDADEAQSIAERWMDEFALLVVHRSGEVASVFLADCWWRDLLSLTWNFRTFHGLDAVETVIGPAFERYEVRSASVSSVVAPRIVPVADGQPYLEAMFEFETEVGEGMGVLRLKLDEDGSWKCWTLLTALQDIRGHEQARGERRPHRLSAPHAGENWSDARARTAEFVDSEPDVLIIGAGHNGLMTAANLGFWGVPTLIIESNPRVGDNWRNRYHSLVLHDAIWADHLPGLDFPDSWPVYLPKDKLGDWLEFYSSALELNVWTSTTLLESSYDDESATWTVRVGRADGSERTLHPHDVVIATGVHGEPRLPVIDGQDEFRGTIVHSSSYRGDEVPAGARAVVIGAGNSAHDAAQHLHNNGVHVTMVQRSSTYVVTQTSNYAEIVGKLYHEKGLPLPTADLLGSSFPNLLNLQRAVQTTSTMAGLDREVLESLENVGYRTDMGIEGAGALSKILSGPGSYYIDVGAAALIASGEIAITHAGVVSITENGVAFDDGSHLDADLIVMATGYKNMRETARRLLGDDAADRSGPVWELDEEGEILGIWRRSGHPGLWFQGGPLYMARFYSRYLALQLHALSLGLAERVG